MCPGPHWVVTSLGEGTPSSRDPRDGARAAISVSPGAAASLSMESQVLLFPRLLSASLTPLPRGTQAARIAVASTLCSTKGSRCSDSEGHHGTQIAPPTERSFHTVLPNNE